MYVLYLLKLPAIKRGVYPLVFFHFDSCRIEIIKLFERFIPIFAFRLYTFVLRNLGNP
jgi:hypothetical protein